MNNIERMLPRHFKILELSLAGQDRKTIAETLGLTSQTISNVSNSPVFQDELSRRRLSVDAQVDSALVSTPVRAKEVLDKNAVSAAERLSQLVESHDEAIAHRASVAILDKVLGGRDTNIQPITINVEQFQLLQSSMEQAAGMSQGQPFRASPPGVAKSCGETRSVSEQDEAALPAAGEGFVSLG